MKKGRHNRANLLGPVKRDVPEVFFRLCHHCLFLNESQTEVQHCVRCDKEFSPKEPQAFYGFLPLDTETDDDLQHEEQLDRQMEEPLDELEESKPPQRRPPLAGLNVKW